MLVSLYGDGALALLHEYVVVAVDSPQFLASFLCVVTNFFKFHCLKYNMFVYLSIYLFIEIEQKIVFSPLQQPFKQWAIPGDILQLHDGRNLVAGIFARSPAVKQLLVGGSEI